MKKKSIILAFSGGLDTTYCVLYLSKIKNFEVHAVVINTGGFSILDIKNLEINALQAGASFFKCIDVKKDYYNSCIKFLVFGNVLKNGVYPLSVSAERVIQAKAIAEYAILKNIKNIAHGSTGAGNDQVRFDMVFLQMIPNVNIITPIRDQKLSRKSEIEFLSKHNINFDFAKASYSINKGLWGTSIGGNETLLSAEYLPENEWPTPATSTEPINIKLIFQQGEITGIDNQNFCHPVDAIEFLQNLAQPYGIARHIHVGDTIIGIKGRVGFEAAAAELIIKAHHLLEKHTLTKWQLFLKEQLGNWYGTWLHDGQLLDPTMRDIEAFMSSSQKTVSGEVYLTLHPYRYTLNGIKSKFDLMSNKFGSYGEMNNAWIGQDVKGFTKIFGNQTSIFQQVQNSVSNE